MQPFNKQRPLRSATGKQLQRRTMKPILKALNPVQPWLVPVKLQKQPQTQAAQRTSRSTKKRTRSPLCYSSELANRTLSNTVSFVGLAGPCSPRGKSRETNNIPFRAQAAQPQGHAQQLGTLGRITAQESFTEEAADLAERKAVVC